MSLDTKLDIKGNVQRVRDTIAESAARVGRNPQSIKLVAVSKTVTVDKIESALKAGITCLGENKVQEAAEKIPSLVGYPLELHLIGSLQKNKANKAVAVFDWVETVDSLELARKMDKASESLNKILPILVQVNLGKEVTKAGIQEESLCDFIREIAPLQHLSVRGLMAIPPFFEDTEQVRPYFRRLRELLETACRTAGPDAAMRELSMGMSHDYPVAIEEGATLVRIGTAIFGERP